MVGKATFANYVILQICSINTEAGVSRWSVKMVILTRKIHKKSPMWESFIKKVAGCWLIKKKLRM